MGYKNTQIGYFTILVFGIVLIFLSVITFSGGINPAEQPILNGALLLFLLLFINFSSLTVQVNRRELIWYFGPGVWKYRIPIEQIRDVSEVKTNPLEGVGFRWNPLKGWLYNVSGLKAVKVIQKDGKATRIGTNEPEQLVQAIREELNYL
ncbi:hypothetical protein [Rhodohalobacter barkolensis]|jgi:hypothetical protein|uniref:DUF5673 domain-containing protein n=1 Tax=Rhodohalobacter barkolensis TaxID=2053187 RepID=A0A2N0VIE2_9BACT|nr:hypothetical protein [Rhodohalobacter barkolensis]PKD43934.1 hypothetical protein CWD77_00175 [Rhodohalobacter barkolensis]